ncbi:hypothetical protein N2603_39525 [Bradyrhizobium huanghuaihaiense]|uniref:hypothetical protein n=1 Tax=Bradyrhizobium huanghuaihaiense TaxID=990078 RepID=UPI0021AA6B4A|nr:hypothetical protein [Bradyrhizobium sp. CB3035]UWU75962.1 hypothetical protein N2603_39525 [Bradyrhizobium sp. CB3035]
MADQTEVGEAAGELKVNCTAADNVNIAFYQNAVPIIRELAIENAIGRDLSDLSVHLTADPPFITPGVWRIQHVANQATHHIRSLDLNLDAAFLAGINASMRAQLRIHVHAAGEKLVEKIVELNLLPPSHWGGVNAAPELLAAFVRPTDPSVDVILREASGKLAAAGRDDAMDGYRKKTKTRAWEIADAVWAALVSHSIAYVLPPKSFERSGQQIRGPSEILSRKVGTCLDLTLLYASCLEQAGLNPVLVLTEGHAFVGVWLVDEDFSSLVIDDPQMLRKRVQLEEMVLVETTVLTGSIQRGSNKPSMPEQSLLPRTQRPCSSSPLTSSAREAPRSGHSIYRGALSRPSRLLAHHPSHMRSARSQNLKRISTSPASPSLKEAQIGSRFGSAIC